MVCSEFQQRLKDALSEHHFTISYTVGHRRHTPVSHTYDAMGQGRGVSFRL
jgi:hypothetical protein